MKKLFKICFVFFICAVWKDRIFAQVNLTLGLVAHYPFNGNPNDVSGNGYNGLLQNGIQITSDRFGAANSAYNFDGIDDYIKIIDNGAFSTPQFSLVIWFQSQSNALQNLVGKRDFLTTSGSGGSQYQFFINYPPFPGIGSNIVGNTASCSDATGSSYVNTGNTICSNKWYLAVVTFDGTRHKIYIDGILVRDIPTSFNGMLACNSELRIGNWWNSDLIPFNGKMDDIRWYNRPLNQQEVNALFNNFSSPTSPVEFTFSQDACNPLRINFVNNTSGIQSNQWFFGDGNNSTATNPVHTYSTNGTFNIKLITTNIYGCTDSIMKPVSVNNAFGDIITTRDSTICQGQSVQLNTIANSDFCWPVTQYLNNGNITNPIATPSQTITYFFNTKKLGNNVVNNSSFSGGNSGFSSEYIYTSVNNTEGQYFVGANPSTWNISMSACTDHTGGSGNMMMVNGSPQANVKVWCQSLAVTPNTNYEFSVWVQSVFPDNPAQLQFSINGVQIGAIFNAGATCNWLRYSSSWSSGSGTTATICIENKNNIAQGNDFALDDITLAPVNMQRDSVTITVLPVPNVRVGNDTTICQGQSVQLSASGASNYTWTPSTGLSNPNIANPIATPAASTEYIVSGFDNPGCVSKDTVQVGLIPVNSFLINPPLIEACVGDGFTITASGGDSYNWYSSSQGNLSSTDQLNIYANSSEIYYVVISNNTCGFTDTLSSTVTVNPNPSINLTKSNDIDCTNPQAQLNASGGSNFSWSPVINISNPMISNPIVFSDQDTWYKVIVTDSKGCTNEDSIFVKSDFSKGVNDFFVPNAFTPNNDGLNDCFNVRFWGKTEEFEFSIYNRWGELVYSTKNRTACWDGTYKGMKQNAGVFVYQIRAKSACSPTPVYRKGTLVLIR